MLVPWFPRGSLISPAQYQELSRWGRTYWLVTSWIHSKESTLGFQVISGCLDCFDLVTGCQWKVLPGTAADGDSVWRILTEIRLIIPPGLFPWARGMLMFVFEVLLLSISPGLPGAAQPWQQLCCEQDPHHPPSNAQSETVQTNRSNLAK